MTESKSVLSESVLASGCGGVCFQQNVRPLQKKAVKKTMTESVISVSSFRL